MLVLDETVALAETRIDQEKRFFFPMVIAVDALEADMMMEKVLTFSLPLSGEGGEFGCS